MPHIMEEMGDLGFILWTEYSFRNGVSVHAELHVVFFKNLLSRWFLTFFRSKTDLKEWEREWERELQIQLSGEVLG